MSLGAISNNVCLCLQTIQGYTQGDETFFCDRHTATDGTILGHGLKINYQWMCDV